MGGQFLRSYSPGLLVPRLVLETGNGAREKGSNLPLLVASPISHPSDEGLSGQEKGFFYSLLVHSTHIDCMRNVCLMNFLDMLSLFLSTLPHCLSGSCLVFKSQFRCHLLGETFLATLPNVAHSPVQFSVPSLCFLHNVRHIEVLCLIVYLLLPFKKAGTLLAWFTAVPQPYGTKLGTR